MDYTIKIEQLEGFPHAEFSVEITNGETTTHHVTVSEPYYEKLTHGTISSYGLLKKSFQFLLEREPNTSIMASFGLEMIPTYFPEYEEEMMRQREQVTI